jgi:RND superfamily putative drug exporter
LRSTVIQKAEHGTNMRAEVGGSSAAYEDLASTISAHLPLQIMVVIALSFARIVLASHLSGPSAGCGRECVVDCRGAWGADGDLAVRRFSRFVGLTGLVPIVSYVPLFVFVMVFGLSMD